ncbi:hypothetical protein OGAPHI_002021 [Ogataea philodendri]|uniref:Uncharacterized protein n=1 Tax=Ogataea philodendri TaxID=1378263 RepID=A0A9P8PA75_9ASCO|nr:uncharacterized protein OGAPHI_002021 [Ogataea philodendri]KAH3668267.1 hypothetical protein OGAPHI_002021 [Ogataea philodendri]
MYICSRFWSHPHTVDVTEHPNTIFTFHELASSSGVPQGLPHGLTRVAVVRAHSLLQAIGGWSGVVVGNTRDIMVQNVGFNNVVEEEPTNKAKVSVNGCSSASSKRPFVAVIVWQSHVGMLEVGDENQPVVGEDVWNQPVDCPVESTKALAPLVTDESLGQHTDVGQHNVPEVTLLKNRRHWIVVRNSKSAVSGVFLTRNVGEQVPPPATKLLHQQTCKSLDRSVFSQLAELDPAVDPMIFLKLLNSLWNKHHISSQVTSGLVVLAVTELPGEVWHVQVRMDDPAHSVVHSHVIGKSVMSAFMTHNP